MKIKAVSLLRFAVDFGQKVVDSCCQSFLFYRSGVCGAIDIGAWIRLSLSTVNISLKSKRFFALKSFALFFNSLSAFAHLEQISRAKNQN